MATNFPSALDGWTDNVASQPVMAGHFNNLQDAVEALQYKVGADATATQTTLDYRINNLFVENTTHMFFYEDTAPTGWNATCVSGDCVLGVVASSGTYLASGGDIDVGTWTITSPQTASHCHMWKDSSGGLDYSWLTTGTKVNIPGVYGVGGGRGMITNGGSCDPVIALVDYYTSGDVHTHTYTSNWRPKAAVGIIAVYVGS